MSAAARLAQNLAIGAICGCVALATWLTVMTVVTSIWNQRSLTTLNLVTPDGNNIDLLAGAGIGIVAQPVDHSIEFSNTGVLAVGAGLGIAVTSTTGALTASNTGVVTVNGLTATGGDMTIAGTNGLSVQNLGSVVSVRDDITYALTQASSVATAPTATYAIAVGTVTAIAVDSWRTGPSPGWPNAFFPGSVGTGGYGNVDGTGWVAPTGGFDLMAVDANCQLAPTTIAADDLQTATLAISFGATSEDPATGVIPAGGQQTVTLAGGTNSGTAPPLPWQVSVSGHVQIGCAGCLVQAGDALTLHVRTDHTGTGVGNYTLVAQCSMIVSHVRGVVVPP